MDACCWAAISAGLAPAGGGLSGWKADRTSADVVSMPGTSDPRTL